LSVDFKLTKGANSGIIYQIKEDPKYKFPFETGPEFQIIDHEGWPDPLEDWQILGANYAMYPPVARPYKAVGEWSHALLVVDGNHVTQILNGQLVVELRIPGQGGRDSEIDLVGIPKLVRSRFRDEVGQGFRF
jgi:hypothetical protein